MLTKDKINQTIHEARGLCWHELQNIEQRLPTGEIESVCKCVKCGWFEEDCKNPDYTSDWSAWGVALEWAKGKEWWRGFAYVWGTPFNEALLNPRHGSIFLAEFIKTHLRERK